MSTSTTSASTFDRLKHAMEERDPAAQIALYADDAEVTLVDRVNTPGHPRVLRGRDEIGGWIRDICARDMTHRVVMELVGNETAAFTEACRYPDGTQVLCIAMLELRHGQIARELGVQAWDE